MGSGRHVYRPNALRPHQKLVTENTAAFEKLSRQARENPLTEKIVLQVDSSLGAVAIGAAIFVQNCSGCHHEKVKLAGPPISEMVTIYSTDKEGLKSWIKAPGKKRPEYPQMPTLTHLTDDDREELAKYILSLKTK